MNFIKVRNQTHTLMTISYNWLLECIKTPLPINEIEKLLTDIGLEVEIIEPYNSIKGGLANVVVGEILTSEQHPNADKLKITTVNVGLANPLNIVCGAPNVAVGQKVLVAQVGAELYPSNGEKIIIKKSKIRGADSEGMLCAEDELGLGASHDGILVLDSALTNGTAAASLYNNYSDYLIYVGLTPNRIDAASHYGVAIDLHAAIQARGLSSSELLNLPKVNLPTAKSTVQIHIAESTQTKRYSGIIINDVQVGESPTWLKNKLNAIGLRSINNVVDVTNYVMHEMGQPLHAFDLSICGKNLYIRNAKNGEELVTLDGVKRKLTENDVVITNENEILCLAGIMGGLKSGVNQNTKSIFLESACFSATHVRKSSKNHALKSDSSFRFERGTNYNACIEALNRAAYLLEKVANAKTIENYIDVIPTPIIPTEITISYDYITMLMGKKIDATEIKSILQLLQFTIANESSKEFKITVPSAKVDVIRPADIVEEILRIHGANNIALPEKFMFSVSEQAKVNKHAIQNTIADLLISNGFIEIMNMTLAPSEVYNEPHVISLANPLSSELNVLRSNLQHGMLTTAAYNINRKQSDLKLFEFGKNYEKQQNAFNEKEELCILLSGNKFKENWQNKISPSDVYQLKNIVDLILEKLNTKSTIKITQIENGINYEFGGNTIAKIIALDKKTTKKYNLSQSVFMASLQWNELIKLHTQAKTTFTELPKFPEVRRDLSLLVDSHITYLELAEEAKKQDKNFIKDVFLFDVYEGDKLPENKKSYAIAYILQNSEATMTDEQTENVMQKIIKCYSTKFNASLRN